MIHLPAAILAAGRQRNGVIGMQRLIQRHLLNDGLVRLTPHLIARYNECLASVGLAPTELKEIDVDGLGVSPQVAKERDDPHYLCNGLANPLALILTPEQFNKPCFYPIYSWQRSLMRALYDRYPKEIADVTGTHPIAVEIDSGLSTLEGPEDLLLLTTIQAIPHVEKIAEAASEQSGLLASFLEDLNCLREDVCDSLVINRKKYGDLRKRRIAMNPISFESYDDFYTINFGGAAVLRHVDGTDLLILENEDAFSKIKADKRRLGSAQVYHLFDPGFALFDKLLKSKWIKIPIKQYREDPKLLEFKKELLLADALCDCEECTSTNWRALSGSARKALLQKHEDKVPAIYFELERFAAALKAGRVFNTTPELSHFLAQPCDTLHPDTQTVLWTLLTHREPRNLLALYTVDKNAFLERYEGWGDAKREWAADYLVERYRHQHRVTQ